MKFVKSKVETDATEYHFDRIMVIPNNLVNRIIGKPNDLFIPYFREDSHIRSNSNLYLTSI